jgi:hypothetical protein
MSKPFVVLIPHHLGQEEAINRLKGGFDSLQQKFGQLISLQDQAWSGNRMHLHVSALGQALDGSIEVFDNQVRVEVVLPWLLGMIAERLQPLIRKEATLLLEKKPD